MNMTHSESAPLAKIASLQYKEGFQVEKNQTLTLINVARSSVYHGRGIGTTSQYQRNKLSIIITD